MTLIAPATWAKDEGWNIAYQVEVRKNIEDETSVLKNKFVNMYKITLDEKGFGYVGKRVKTLSTGKDAYQAVFSIAPGEVVKFLAFKNKATALKSKNKIKKTEDFFGIPPWKNFSVVGKSMELCLTAGVDFENKLQNETTGKAFCEQGENGYLQGIIELQD